MLLLTAESQYEAVQVETVGGLERIRTEISLAGNKDD